MTWVYLGIGSNIEREDNIRYAVKALKSAYGDLNISPIYESRAYGFEGDDFYNLVVGFETECDIKSLEAQLKNIEYQSGRKKNDDRFCARTLDIDLLLYGALVCEKHQLPRADITAYAFVLKPFCDIAPDFIHPVEKKTIGQLWENFSDPRQKINQIALTL